MSKPLWLSEAERDAAIADARSRLPSIPYDYSKAHALPWPFLWARDGDRLVVDAPPVGAVMDGPFSAKWKMTVTEPRVMGTITFPDEETK